MNKQLLSSIFVAFLLFSILVISQVANCQTATPDAAATPTPTETAAQGSPLNLLLIVGIVVVVAVVAAVSAFVLVKKRSVNEKSLRKSSSRQFEEWVIKRFNGKPSDPSTGVNGFTEGGQPLLIVQSDNVNLGVVEDFIKVLSKGKAQKGTIVALSFDKDAAEGKMTALDKEIELQLLPINELLNKRYSKRIESLARASATFEAPLTGMAEEYQTAETKSFENMPHIPQNGGLKPRVFISNSNTKVAGQVKKMLEFLHYDYAVGDKEETTVPISTTTFGLMRECDCAVINIAAAEQERRYSGLYVLNSNVTSEINAAYLKYNTQVVLLVERKIDLPSNLKGLKRIEYDSDDLSFNAAMDLEKVLADFKKI